MTTSTTPPDVVVSVPGPWKDRAALLAALRADPHGLAMVRPGRNSTLNVLIEDRPHDPRTHDAFAAAGAAWVAEADLDAIDSHKLIAYVIAPGGSIDRAGEMLDHGAALLRVGGLAIKVETADVAHSEKTWLQFAAQKRRVDLYRAYVAITLGDDASYSCGLHNLGLRDAEVEGEAPGDDTFLLLDRFCRYSLSEKADLHAGDTFGVARDAPVYQLQEKPCTRFVEGDLLHNPFGMWNLVRTE